MQAAARHRNAKRLIQPSLAVVPVARFVPQTAPQLMSAATMLFTPAYHSRPVALFKLGDAQLYVTEVSLSPLGDPVWVRLLPADATPIGGKWVYHRPKAKERFISGMFEPVYLFEDGNPLALEAAMSDALSTGCEVSP